MDCIPALTLWDLVIEVFHSVLNRTDGPKRESHGGNPSAVVKLNMHSSIRIRHTNVSSNTTISGSGAMLYVFTDNEAVINDYLRLVSRTHRVTLDWLVV